jgi:hypothetical protein
VKRTHVESAEGIAPQEGELRDGKRQPSRLIEPETVTRETGGDVINWTPWERDYREKLGIELTDADRLEIKTTVPAYFRLLSQIEKRLKSK